MEWYRIANLVMQAVYLPVHIVLIIRLIKNRQPTPIWRWFTIVVVGLWVMISGRLLESIAYIFFPVNDFYVFAVYYQLVGTTFATSAYLIWNLYLAGHERLSESRIFKAFMLTLASAVCIIVCTNGFHNLFYEKLVMGEPVVHGKFFLPCLLIVYGTLFVGWIISIVHIIRKEKDKLKRIVVFSLYPIMPAVAALVRSITKIDTLDYMPIIMTVSIICLYLMIFRFRYVDLFSQSIEKALENTQSALFIFNSLNGEIVYKNKSCEAYDSILKTIIKKLSSSNSFEDVIEEKHIHVSAVSTESQNLMTVVITDVSDIVKEREMLDKEIEKQNNLVEELEIKQHNIDAYLGSLYEIPRVKEKQEKIAYTKRITDETFEKIAEDLSIAESGKDEADEALNDVILLTQNAISKVRETVTALKEN